MSQARPLAMVTGASSGIGAVFARALAARGYDLVLVARRKDRLEGLAAELKTHSELLQADLGAPDDLANVERRIAERPVDLLVNNAGFGSKGRFFEAGLDVQDQMHRVHIIATFRLTYAALAGMTARRHGAIINVSSVAGFTQNPGSVSYCATKAWINSFTEGLYLELRAMRSPVKVQALCPGYTYSEFHDVIKWDRSHVAKWLWMSAESVVEASLQGLDRRRLFVVPGWPYRMMVFLARWVPRPIWHAAILRASRRLGRVERTST